MGEPRQFSDIIPDTQQCFYRLYTNHTMYVFLQALRQILIDYGSLGQFAEDAMHKHNPKHKDAITVLTALSDYFWNQGLKGVCPTPLVHFASVQICFFVGWCATIRLWTSGYGPTSSTNHLLSFPWTHMWCRPPALLILSRRRQHHGQQQYHSLENCQKYSQVIPHTWRLCPIWCRYWQRLEWLCKRIRFNGYWHNNWKKIFYFK